MSKTIIGSYLSPFEIQTKCKFNLFTFVEHILSTVLLSYIGTVLGKLSNFTNKYAIVTDMKKLYLCDKYCK